MKVDIHWIGNDITVQDKKEVRTHLDKNRKSWLDSDNFVASEGNQGVYRGRIYVGKKVYVVTFDAVIDMFDHIVPICHKGDKWNCTVKALGGLCCI